MSLIEATDDHVTAILPRLRREDVIETLRFGKTLHEALAYTMAHSQYRKAWIVDGEVACIFGIGITSIGNKALPWMWATDLIEVHIKEFVKNYLAIMREALALYPVVEGVIGERYRPYLAWLEKHGAVVSPPFWHEQAQTNFYRYEMRRA